jgi:hypothetical protein
VTTYAPQDTTRDERVREAWTVYRDSIAALDGPEYEVAEADSWDHLQTSLRDIEREHGTPSPRDDAGG